jgi:small subunit ribosomal protein S1
MLKFSTPIFGTDKTENLLLKYNYQVKINDILAGSFIGLERSQSLVHVGLPQAAFLPPHESFIHLQNKSNQIFQKNKASEFIVIYYQEGKTILSLQRLHYLKLWERFKQIDFKNMILYTFLEKTIQGSKLVNFDGLSIYLPNTHLPKYYRRRNDCQKQIEVKVLEVKDKKHSIIASPRLAFLKKQSPSLQIGLIQVGIILAVKSFGLFLNVYGIKSLLHVSEISNRKIENLDELYAKGDKIQVRVIYINLRQGKIAVSAKL